jgi:hypothetical protein
LANEVLLRESMMRVVCAMGVALAIACLMPATSRADAPGPAAAATTAAPSAPGCKCLPARPHRHARHHARYHRRWHAPVAGMMGPPAMIAPAYYNPGIPSPWDSAYDRAMTLHFRNVFVTGIFDPEPGYPETPPVRGVQPYRYPSGPAVFQYDGLTGQYVQLAQYDAARALPPPAAPAPGPATP